MHRENLPPPPKEDWLDHNTRTAFLFVAAVIMVLLAFIVLVVGLICVGHFFGPIAFCATVVLLLVSALWFFLYFAGNGSVVVGLLELFNSRW